MRRSVADSGDERGHAALPFDVRMPSLPSRPSFHVDVDAGVEGRRTRVAVTGDVDVATVDVLREAVLEQLRSGPVLLDLAAVTFMDSSGVRMLDRLRRACADDDLDLVVKDDLPPAVSRVLEITGMLPVLRLEGDDGGPAR